MTDVLSRGRESFERQEWGEAYRELSRAASTSQDVTPADLELVATAAYLTGRDAESEAMWTRAHERFLTSGDAERAARSAFWLGLLLVLRGEEARGGGWLARADRIVRELPGESVVSGYVLVAAALQRLGGGAPDEAYETFAAAIEVGERYAEADLRTLGHLGRGQSLVAMGDPWGATRSLDEAMVAVEAREVSVVVAGIVYCAVILTCQQIHDLRRAQQWTSALSDWCAAQPDLVPYRGQCLVHRSQLLQLRGQWPAAMEEALRACRRLSDPPGQPALGMALYQRAELHRLRGELDDAEGAYRQSARRGHSPHPGLALLRLAQHRVEDARGAICRVVDETHAEGPRAEALGAYVEIMLAAGDVDAARAAADELTAFARRIARPLLEARAASARGAVLLAEGDGRGAAEELSRARETWDGLDVPYEAARVRVLLDGAYRLRGDPDTGRLERDTARVVFEEVGALPDLERLREQEPPATARAGGALTSREVEVMRLVAAGLTNRDIAGALVISEKTVARHLSNIFTKLDLPNRAAATAYAYEQGLM